MEVGYTVSYLLTQFQVSANQKEGEPSFFPNQNVTFQQTKGKGREMWNDEYRISGLTFLGEKQHVGRNKCLVGGGFLCLEDVYMHSIGLLEWQRTDCIEWRYCSLQMKALLLYSLFQIARKGIWN